MSYPSSIALAINRFRVGRSHCCVSLTNLVLPTFCALFATFQVVHERWNEDYGDFYRKSVPNTLLKVAKQLDPNAKLEYSDLVDSAYPELRGAAADRGVSAGTNGLDRTPTIKITPAMREAYQEKGQSLFVPGAATIVAGKLVVDKVTKEQEDDRAKATR